MSEPSVKCKLNQRDSVPDVIGAFGLRVMLLILRVLFRRTEVRVEVSRQDVVFLRHQKFLIKTDKGYLFELLRACLSGTGDMCLGEGYIDNRWRVSKGDLADVLFAAICVWENSRFSPFLRRLQRRYFLSSQGNTPNDSRNNVAHHYDLGNGLYKNFLDGGMNYSSGIFEPDEFFPEYLENAQNKKNQLLASLLDLSSDSIVLEIGCGWGSLSRQIAKHSKSVTGISLSEEQIEWCLRKTRDLPAGLRPTYLLQDYREHCAKHKGKYDQVVSVEMFDHVGKKHHREFFDAVYNSLTDDGALVMQVLVRPKPGATSLWIDKYIFPGAYIAAYSEIEDAFSASGFCLDENCSTQFSGFHYATTLKAWKKLFEENWVYIHEYGYDQKFYRMWIYYLSASQMIFEHGGFYTMHLRLRKVGAKTKE